MLVGIAPLPVWSTDTAEMARQALVIPEQDAFVAKLLSEQPTLSFRIFDYLLHETTDIVLHDCMRFQKATIHFPSSIEEPYILAG